VWILIFSDGVSNQYKKESLLKRLGLLPVAVIKRKRSGKSDSLKEFARMQWNSKTEDLNMEEWYRNIRTITEESFTEVLQQADKAETIEVAIRLALHCFILYANEYDQWVLNILIVSTKIMFILRGWGGFCVSRCIKVVIPTYFLMG